jgi:hypothetical protein
MKDDFRAFHFAVFYWIDSCLYAFIPFVLLLGSNVMMARLLLSAEQRRALMGQKKSSASSLTPMLMAVSWCYLLLNLPLAIFFLGRSTWPDGADGNLIAGIHTWLAYTVCHLLYYSNSAVNFFLYCCTGSKFRSVLGSLLRRICPCLCCTQRKQKGERAMNVFSVTTTTRVNDGRRGSGSSTAS